MSDLYFAQYLLNTGEVTSDELPGLLAASVSADTELALLAMHEGLISGEQVAELGAAPEAFAAAAQEKKYLTAAQIANLRKLVPDESVRFAQVFFKMRGHDYRKLGALMAAGREAKDPVRDAVRRVGRDLLETEVERYSDFVGLFLRSVIRFMDTPAAISYEAMALTDAARTVAVSQRLFGDLNLVTGLFAREDVFVEMARRYSHEDLHSVDEMATDSLGEFLNVVNGLFAVDMARQDLEIDLGMPRVEENVLPTGNRQLLLHVCTAFGSFALVIAADEFVFKDKD